MTVWGTIGNALKTGAKKVGKVAKTGKDKLVDVLSSDTISQSPTEPTPNPAPEPISDDTIKTPEEIDAEARRKAFIKALSSGEQALSSVGQQLAKQQTMNDYQFTPSRVDYSRFIGLSPETQRYLYGGM